MNRKEWAFWHLNLPWNSIFAIVSKTSYRYFLELAYKGTHYHGWQSQKNAQSIQETLEEALAIILRRNVSVMGSGRTDTGVHASQQFVHFDVEVLLDGSVFLKKLNAVLPKDIAAYQLRLVKADAHARFDAKWRSYIYKITYRKNPFEQELSWHYFRELNLEKMNEAAALLTAHDDFECFSKVRTDVNHFGCKIKAAYWEQKGHELHFHITANRFLRGMVRAIVGTLVDVGEGKLSPRQFQEILESRDRSQAGSSAPASGLFLCEVIYPEEIFI
ncbi:tRNA pseudouridine38-40 synthase [Belliella buryatensis]|uniref:tRNA pseudouridine synthase A n=1 Tax=Belliella buryatensis TaxID=1500549 RepID=A0A239BCZ6_9BACT|nr:tRNA pseudouridine(38-40) synthase TruA [Belliella buryatensis]SNS05706.1 tRNA pseudouridine38-40 synthase [Belliella buryatensis]